MAEATVAEFTSNFLRYQEIARHEPVSVTSHGQTVSYFVSAAHFEAFQDMKAGFRRCRSVVEMSTHEVDDIALGRMSPEHDHLNALLD